MYGPSMVNTTYQGAIVSVYNAGQAIGGLTTGYVADKLSRKYTILIASILTIIGAVLQCAAVNIGMMIAGRLVAGIGCGQILSVVPIYLAEVSKPDQRGFLVGLQGMMIAIGFGVANWIGYAGAFAKGDGQWRIPLAMQLPIPVQKDARDLLPLAPLPISTIDEKQVRIVQGLSGFQVPEVIQRLRTTGASSRSPDEELFAHYLSNAIHSLREWVQEPLFHDAVLSPTILRLPYGIDGGDAEETVIMALRLKISHPVISSGPNCQWVPLNFFGMRQVLEQSRQEFVRVLHQDFDPSTMPASRANNELTSGPLSTLRRLKGSEGSAHSKGKKPRVPIMRLRASSKDSTRSSSTINLCPAESSEAHNDRLPSTDTVDVYPPERHYTSHQQSFLNGGIVVFQEVTVQVEQKKSESRSDLELSWSHDTVTEPPKAHQRHNKKNEMPVIQSIELQPSGRGTTEVSVESRWLHSFGHVDNNITTMASFIDTLIIESSHSAT
ncbi:hypothetical protein QWA68_011462 [Fusarium oxysporum]|nr:hypothetical protein QWA68_011462 [Fusarium oxysporum]